MNRSALDTGQYSDASIDHYEAIFGRDFVSPGGMEMARGLVGWMNLPRGSRILDVGCGLGGAAFLMAEEFGLFVDGIDLSANMIQRARKRWAELGSDDRISLALGDCLELDAVERYDAIYSRDVFLHISDKARLFGVLRQALKPGGALLFTDYCCGESPWQPAFSDYVEQRGYHLLTIPGYQAILQTAGLSGIEAWDWTNRFIECLQDEAGAIGSAGFDGQTTQALQQSWQDKIDRARSGDHRWGLFRAMRPATESPPRDRRA